jgi:hypothetical protein
MLACYFSTTLAEAPDHPDLRPLRLTLEEALVLKLLYSFIKQAFPQVYIVCCAPVLFTLYSGAPLID